MWGRIGLAEQLAPQRVVQLTTPVSVLGGTRLWT